MFEPVDRQINVSMNGRDEANTRRLMKQFSEYGEPVTLDGKYITFHGTSLRERLNGELSADGGG